MRLISKTYLKTKVIYNIYKMIVEIKTDNNCIVKAFENNPISIITENIDDKKIYCFKASDIGKALNIVNIRTSIMNFDEDEQVVRKAYDLRGCEQDTIFLTSQGVYRLLYNSKKEAAKKFRKWAGNILDDIIFNESAELKKQLQEKEKELEYTKKELQKKSICTVNKWYNVEPCDTVYAFRNKDDPYIKIGKTENIKKREDGYTCGNRTSEIFYFRKCHSCKLTEKVLHHILDKYRLDRNREWFNISEELAIYTIDMVCNFLDSFIGCSEELINLKVNEQLTNCIKQIKKNIEEPIEQNKPNENLVELQQDTVKNKEETLKEHFDKFVNEYCIVSDSSKCLSLEILGAYRMWNKNTNIDSKKHLTTYMKNNYKKQSEYLSEHKTKLSYYLGIQPKNFIIKQENENNLPYYEEFILSECKFDYTYRTTKSILFNEFNDWVLKKYPNYTFSKNEKTHYESYLNRAFLNCKKIHIQGGVNGYYGLQLKNNPQEILGISISRRKKVYKINYITNDLLETYDSLYETAVKNNVDEKNLYTMIYNKYIFDDKFFLSYTYEKTL